MHLWHCSLKFGLFEYDAMKACLFQMVMNNQYLKLSFSDDSDKPIEDNTTLGKYWKAVKENPSDFTGWTYLLQYVEQEVNMYLFKH